MSRSFDTAAAPHAAPQRSVRQVMAWVLLSLAPAVAVQTLYFGPAVLAELGLACAFALGLESLMLRLRGLPLRPFLGDLSAPVCAVLFALCLPPGAPWWISLSGMVAAIVVAKHCYGGLGYNLFNPAMVGYVVVLLCFPREFASWPPYLVSGGDAWGLLGQIFQPAAAVDAIAGATALDSLRNLRGQGLTLAEIADSAAFLAPATEHRIALAVAYLLGGLVLLRTRIIPWQTPFAVLLGMLMLALPLWLSDPDHYASPMFHWLTGASLIGAFFIATDPVSGCTTPRGRWIFGLLLGLLTILIRQWGNYPDGFAFAVLIMNSAAPWIDLHGRRRVYGESRSDG